MVRVLIILGVLTGLVGCGHYRYFEGFNDIPPDSASVYIIRPNHFVGMGMALEVVVGDKPLGYLQSGHFLDAVIAPGEHKVVVSTGGLFGEQRELIFYAQPNERVFLTAGFGLEGYFGIEQVDAETGLAELKEFAKN